MTAEQKRVIKTELFLEVKKYTDKAIQKAQQGQETESEMFMVKMYLENIDKLDQFPNE